VDEKGSIGVERVPGGLAVVTLRGEHDVATAGTLREQLGALDAEGASVVVDLEATAFIDSTILGVIIGGLRRAREGGRPFALVLNDAASPNVGRIFQLTGLRLIFSVHSTRDEAIAAVRQGTS
jgi:anti-sigma B factor antagonist